MVRGAKFSLQVTFTNAAGEPTPEEVINDMQLSLYSSDDKTTIAKEVSVGNGVTMVSQGVYKIEIADSDTLKLPENGNALLEGWLLPVKKKIVFELGEIKGNVKNG